ncbi:hypothetical protein SAMN04488058_101369 [Deinococcus reticulitermitis]|uniref:Acetoacetate decarboxylase (ADC) n=2 Tax=Deinococcus reticulitermitis TaxID=856736 RepID=A0A1H6SPA9_9DEIO|nr:hypothetical protein SAMN04488058_101369 [Deinococcus reticulitermitis]
MLVRYASSPVGRYDEWLWLAPTRSPRGWRPGIRRIGVNSPASLEWGRRNWAIPKELTAFAWAPGSVELRDAGGALLARGRFGGMLGAALPCSLAGLPRSWRTLAQPGDRGWRWTTVQGEGRVRLARWQVEAAPGLPEVEGRVPWLVLGVPEFRLVFPCPESDLAAEQAPTGHP